VQRGPAGREGGAIIGAPELGVSSMDGFRASILVATIMVAFGQHAMAEENVMTGKPTAQDFMDALSPTRGIKPRDDPDARPEVSLPIVHFAFGSAALAPEAQAVLEALAAALGSDELAGSRFLIEGHTDAVGSEAYNQELSKQRAEAVRRYLAAKQIEPTRLESAGKGESELLDPTQDASELNRRVRVVNLGSTE
jgi:outer membrane protein OmpA-like peptidoglycan-associated protein